jgi:hypothetical protein
MIEQIAQAAEVSKSAAERAVDALIGAVNVIQNKAEPGQFDAAGGFAIGDLNYHMGELMVNLPVGDTAAIRFATRLKTRDGYVENLLGGEDYNGFNTQAFRLSGAFEPTDGFRFDLIANYQSDDSPGTSFKSLAYAPVFGSCGA